MLKNLIEKILGKQAKELLEKRLSEQDLFNDVLATRMIEALEKVNKLKEQAEFIQAASREVKNDYSNFKEQYGGFISFTERSKKVLRRWKCLVIASMVVNLLLIGTVAAILYLFLR